jgi:hypothetical protein
MMKAIILFVALGLAAAESDQCKQSVFDECHYGTPFTSIHADTIEICEETCNIYASIDSCDFYTYTTEGAVDENCDIFTSPQSQSEFQDGCNIIGLPIGDECVVYEETCDIVEPCTSCTACGAGTCAGYMESKCQITGKILETYPAELNTCQALCSAQTDASFLVLNKEAEKCECYDTSVVKNCKMAIIQQGTDLTTCRA